MVVAVVGADDGRERGGGGGLTRSKSWTGTVDIGYALGDPVKTPALDWRGLALPAIYGACVAAAALYQKSWASAGAGLLLLLAAGPTYLSRTYTLWNMMALAGQIADGLVRPGKAPRLVPFLVVNSWAIFTSFNVMAVAHPPHFRELAKRLESSLAYFHLLNTLGHFVPAVIATVWFLRLDAAGRDGACEWTRFAPVAYAPLAFHFAWALRVAGGLSLDRVYLKRPKFQWYVAWATAAATHLAVGFRVARACAASTPH